LLGEHGQQGILRNSTNANQNGTEAAFELALKGQGFVDVLCIDQAAVKEQFTQGG
jgi:hypothetical protein